ncbi:MAG: ribosome recycling factor [Candidatus Obscuribacterales bacterium]|nr:ribosome recycling factor [Candidatus Obscuribacterales bacterium]
MSTAEDKMKKALEALKREFQTVRTGRANPGALDRVEAEYYGTMTPLKSLANITVPDARTLLISPYDKTSLKEIEKAITSCGLGFTPNNDGNVIRIIIPALTEERRKEMTKIVRKYGEEARVAIRNIRRDAMDELKKLKGAALSEDDFKRQEDSLQKLTDKYVKEVDKMTSDKEAEVMEV